MKSVRVYLAAKFDRRDEMRAVADTLHTCGHDVVSRWLNAEKDDSESDDAAQTLWAIVNIADVLRCDVLVFFSERAGSPGAARGGRQVDLGAALAAGKKVIVVGPVEHVYHRHPRVTVVRNLTELVVALRVYAEAAA